LLIIDVTRHTELVSEMGDDASKLLETITFAICGMIEIEDPQYCT